MNVSRTMIGSGEQLYIADQGLDGGGQGVDVKRGRPLLATAVWLRWKLKSG